MPELTSASTFLPAGEQAAAPTDGEAHLWRIALNTALPPTSLLSAEEQIQLLNFQFPKDRDRYRICHVALRRILARYTGSKPVDLAFTTGPWGKPSLTSRHGTIEFNLAHSGSLALVAVGGMDPIGVDLEAHRDDLNAADLAPRIFSTEERQQFDTLAPQEKRDRLYHAWTTKEAVLKALGTGLSIEPDCVSTPPPESGPQTAEVRFLGESVTLHVRTLDVAEGFSAALASPAPITQLTCYEYTG